MISRRIFSRLPAAAAAASVAAVDAAEDEHSAANLDARVRRDILGSWNTLMTFSTPPPPPLPPSFLILETFISKGEYISIAALPHTTSAHGSWDTAEGQKIKTRSRLIVLPQLLGAAVRVEITELIGLDWGRYTYTGTFTAVFTPEVGAPFTLTGTPRGARIPPP